MARYFVRITEAEFADYIRAAFTPFLQSEGDWTDEELEGMLPESILGNTLTLGGVSPVLMKDYQKVDFDFENCYATKHDFVESDPEHSFVGINTLPNGLTYCGIVVGGDWEEPILFIVYWSGKELRAYVPNDGNTFNLSTKAAYGNDETADGPEASWRKLDLPVLLADIQNRLVEKP